MILYSLLTGEYKTITRAALLMRDFHQSIVESINVTHNNDMILELENQISSL